MKKNNTNYDVVIVGGGTAGCSCAWNCSKLGLKTLLIEKNHYLGGAITSQLVVPAMRTNHNDFNMSFYKHLCAISHDQKAQITYIDDNPGWLNPIKLPNILYNELKSVNCDILLNSYVIEVEKERCIVKKHNDNISNQNKILSICIDTIYNDNLTLPNSIEKKYSDNIGDTKKHKIKKYSSKFFVDATGDANLSFISGGKFLAKESTQAMSLRFIMSNVDKKAFLNWILEYDTNRNVTTGAVIEDEIHLSTAYTWDLNSNWALKPIFEDAISKNILKDTDTAYFQVFSIAGEDDKIAFNCPRIVGKKEFNPLKENDKSEAKKLAIGAIERISRFCNTYLKGFENAKIYKIADELGIRESRRVKGKYILSKEDIYSAKEFKNPVAYSNYPIDIHSIKKDNSTLDYVQKTYCVPLESLIVNGFDNLFVAGRCLSADFYAQAAVRIQPTCFAMGEGLAKYLTLL